MKLIPQFSKQFSNLTLVLTLLCLSLQGCYKHVAKKDPPSPWQNVSLNKEDTQGSSALLALVRNSQVFADWLQGEELGENTQIAILYRPARNQNPKKTVNGDKVLEESLTRTRYVVAEKNPDTSLKRIAIIEEQANLTVEKLNEVQDDGKINQSILKSEVNFEYPAVNARPESAPSQAYAASLEKLWSDKLDCVDHGNQGAKLCRISDAAIKLIRNASKQAQKLALEISKLKTSKDFDLDTSAPKVVSFEENVKTKEIRNIVLSGFIKKTTEKLLAPDATSAWTVEISDEGDIHITERKQDAVLDTQNLNFEI
jgi:hypothetical protein